MTLSNRTQWLQGVNPGDSRYPGLRRLHTVTELLELERPLESLFPAQSETCELIVDGIPCYFHPVWEIILRCECNETTSMKSCERHRKYICAERQEIRHTNSEECDGLVRVEMVVPL